MSRLPVPGGDNDAWGSVLNDFLLQGHTPEGLNIAAPISYGLSLPASPVDGQEAILVDSLTAPLYSWRFRYSTAVTGSHKWLFIGGPPLAAYDGPAVPHAVGVFSAAGPTLILPRPGVYVLQSLSNIYCTALAAYLAARWAVYPGGAVLGAQMDTGLNATGLATSSHISQVVTVAAAGPVCVFAAGNGNIVYTRERLYTAFPVRVS